MDKDRRLGAIPSPYDIRDYKLAGIAKTGNLPQFLDLGITKIKDQGVIPTCVAHSLSEIIEYHHKKESGKYIEFSTEFIYGYRQPDSYIGDGMYLRDGLETIREYGDVPKSELPGNHDVVKAMNNVKAKLDSLLVSAYPNRITSYYRIESIQDLKYSLFRHGPVAASMWWYDGMDVTKSGRLHYDDSRPCGGHAVMIVGWEGEEIIVQNSWGKSWGLDGRFLVSESEFFNLFFDVFGITDEIEAVKKPSKLVNATSGLLNKIIRFFRR